MVRKSKSPKGTLKCKLVGRRMGTKRRDMRWLSPDGQEWDSKLEAEVYESLHKAGYTRVRRTRSGRPGEESDTFVYTVPVRNASCDVCKSTAVSKRRTYTADFYSPDA